MKRKDLKVCVLFGGQSSEHDVSRQSASYIIDVLKRLDLQELHTIGITQKGEFIHYRGDSELIRNNEWLQHADNQEVLFKPGQSGFFTQKDGEINWQAVDVFFPVLHGKNGEDGTIQGLFDMINAPFVGCGVLASSVSMDKVASRMLFDQAGIPQAKWTWLRNRDFIEKEEQCISDIENTLPYPIFVKPANAGSSVGISKAHNREELVSALVLAFKHDEKAVLEESIHGREIELAVLEDLTKDEHIVVSLPGEIIPDREFYDFESKYISNGSKLLIPANLTETEISELQALAKRTFETVDGKGLSRVDFFVDLNSGKILLNEINTLPGFTEISMYPKLMIASGYTEEELVEKLLQSSLVNIKM